MKAENLRQLSNIRFSQNDVEGSLRDSETAIEIYAQLTAGNPQSFEIRAAAVKPQIEYGEI